tara:strand:- start:133 stop:363 length:231 start_codon:yes stop_codon:yes gene_type:complete
MGISKTTEALNRLETSNPEVYKFLTECWSESFTGTLTNGDFDDRVWKAKIDWLKDQESYKDIDFVISSIKLNISSQ